MEKIYTVACVQAGVIGALTTWAILYACFNTYGATTTILAGLAAGILCSLPMVVLKYEEYKNSWRP